MNEKEISGPQTNRIKYVYPNVSELNRGGRGSMEDRWIRAQECKCELIEMPADFIKNKTEMEITGLKLGDYLTARDVLLLYLKNTAAGAIPYVLHTEPAIPRKVSYDSSFTSTLNWYDDKWVERLIDMVIILSTHLGGPASIIEIHPGDERNSYESLISASNALIKEYKKEFDCTPLILLENRTGQFISSGFEIRDYWDEVVKTSPDTEKHLGIVLDVQQLFTVTRSTFLEQFNSIPSGSLKAFHIHARHQVPSENDPIPWRDVFDRIRSLKKTIYLNPEVHHGKRLAEAIGFCERMLSINKEDRIN